MKKLYSLIFCLLGLSSLKAQQMTNNPVQSLDVVYQQLTDSTVMVQTSIRLSTLSDEQKIHMDVFNAASSEPFYSVTYSLNGNQISEGQMTLYTKSEGVITINLPNSIKLNAYRYEIYFEDANGNKSLKFSEIK